MAITCATCNHALALNEAGLPCPQCGDMGRKMAAEDQSLLVEEKTRVARKLAHEHFHTEVGLTQIFRIRGHAEVEVNHVEPIKLLEVNENTFSAGVHPLQFGPANGIPFPSVIVEVTPDEFAKIQSDQLKLPKGWTIGEEIAKIPDGAEGG